MNTHAFDPLLVARSFRASHLRLQRRFPWLKPERAQHNHYLNARKCTAQKAKLP